MADQREEGAVTVVLADDHVVVRTGLRLLLSKAPDLEVVAEADDADQALRAALGHKPDILLLDLNMPGTRSVLETIPLVVQAAPATRVVVLTMEEDPAYARRALRAGAAAYVLKQEPDAEVLDAVRRVAAGGTYLNPGLGAALAAGDPDPGDGLDDLTPIEVELLRLVALGHTNAEVALTMHLSKRTVETHRARLQQKLGRTSRAEIVRYALDHGLLDTTADRPAAG